MPRPKPQAALSKAPSREHPARPDSPALADVSAATTSAPPAPAGSAPVVGQDIEVMFSARVPKSLRTRVRRYSVEADRTIQQITDEALRDYLDKHGAP